MKGMKGMWLAACAAVVILGASAGRADETSEARPTITEEIALRIEKTDLELVTIQLQAQLLQRELDAAVTRRNTLVREAANAAGVSLDTHRPDVPGRRFVPVEGTGG